LLVALLACGQIGCAQVTEVPLHVRHGAESLEATLLLPSGSGPHPAVVLIHGTGQQTRDEWRFFGELFAEHGIAALLYDKRDVGRDPSGMDLVGLQDLAGDALAAVRLLQSRADIRRDSIGLWGISQGGWVAPMVAAQAPEIAFVIAVSAPGVSYAELNLFAVTNRLRRGGFDGAQVTAATTALQLLDDFVRYDDDRGGTQAMLDAAQRQPWCGSSTLPATLPTAAQRQSWLRWRDLDLDPATYWENVRVPVLLIYGENDEVVPVERSIERITEALTRVGNSLLTVHVFPAADHDLALTEHDGTRLPGAPRISPGYFEILTRWPKEQLLQSR
jgi:dipeptidyl aminopeptidase/acylaminoacyl peptidase